jgi:conjugal transfer pilin signal peptidase TrbI
MENISLEDRELLKTSVKKNFDEQDAYVASASEKAESKMDMYVRHADNLYWKLMEHAKRQFIAWALAGLSMFLFASNYQLGWNRTESLPYHLFLVHKGERAEKGELVAFAWDGGGKYAWMSPFKPGATMVKYILGKPGDYVLSDVDGEYSVNGVPHARVKPFSKTGKPLTPLLSPGTQIKIGENKYYVGTPHKDGLDSRYDMVGLLDGSRFIGKVYVVF